MAVVKEPPSARAQEREHVLEVRAELATAPSVAGSSGPRRAVRRRTPETAADLEATRADVLVRQAIAREMEDWPQEERRESRPARHAGRGARGHVERDDHGCAS